MLKTVHAFANMHTVELMPETRAGFISGVLPTLECFRAIVDTPHALMCPDAPDGHVLYTAGARAALRW
ncbi:hypothetical protein C8J57DRAFT_1545705 [Mycena rebaudengoi]|nr:hypothetical protein C8J57DRAFT_1545705 [Mycena rebaudengoi]